MTTKFKEGDELISNISGENKTVVYVGRWACTTSAHAVKNADGTISIIPEHYLKKKQKTVTVTLQDWYFIGSITDIACFESCEITDYDSHAAPLWVRIGEPYTKTFVVPE